MSNTLRTMVSVFLAVILLSFAGIGTAHAQVVDPQPVGDVVFMHGIPGNDGFPLDVYLDGDYTTPIATGFTFGQVTAPVRLASGQYTVEYHLPGTPAGDDTRLFVGSLAVSDGTHQTYSAYVDNTLGDPLVLVGVPTNLTAIPAGQAKLAAYNMSSYPVLTVQLDGVDSGTIGSGGDNMYNQSLMLELVPGAHTITFNSGDPAKDPVQVVQIAGTQDSLTSLFVAGVADLAVDAPAVNMITAMEIIPSMTDLIASLGGGGTTIPPTTTPPTTAPPTTAPPTTIAPTTTILGSTTSLESTTTLPAGESTTTILGSTTSLESTTTLGVVTSYSISLSADNQLTVKGTDFQPGSAATVGVTGTDILANVAVDANGGFTTILDLSSLESGSTYQVFVKGVDIDGNAYDQTRALEIAADTGIPWWAWLLGALLIGGIIFAIWWFFFRSSGDDNAPTYDPDDKNNAGGAAATPPSTTPTAGVPPPPPGGMVTPPADPAVPTAPAAPPVTPPATAPVAPPPPPNPNTMPGGSDDPWMQQTK